MSIKNRGALSNPEGRFDILLHESMEDGWYNNDGEDLPPLETVLFPEKAKTIISRNDSPDINFDQTINPYRGCEHGCIYCYARPAHAYINLSPGLDFETKIFHKVNAAQLLEKELSNPRYKCKPIILGGNTDPYQPAEKKLLVTRSILEVLMRYHHPVVIITKSSLIERDKDLIAEMAKLHLAKVAISITTLSTKLKRTLEPRTSSPSARLRVIKNLSDAQIPIRVMAAPMISMINDNELESILENAKNAGAIFAGYTLIRLPHEVKDLFKEWLRNYFPERESHVMSLIRQMRGGKEYDATFGKRMTGEGEFARMLALRFKTACNRLKLNEIESKLDTTLFKRIQLPKNDSQLDLWER